MIALGLAVGDELDARVEALAPHRRPTHVWRVRVLRPVEQVGPVLGRALGQLLLSRISMLRRATAAAAG
jgi:hypothetical protein